MAFSPFNTFRSLPTGVLPRTPMQAPTPGMPTVIGNISQPSGVLAGAAGSPGVPPSASGTPFIAPENGQMVPPTDPAKQNPFQIPRQGMTGAAPSPFTNLGQKRGVPVLPRSPARAPGAY